MPDDAFRAFFKDPTVVKEGPYPYQEKLAAASIESLLIHVPTGCGKTTLLKKPPEMSSLRAAKGMCFVCFQ